jgi:hypothetical protein
MCSVTSKTANDSRSPLFVFRTVTCTQSTVTCTPYWNTQQVLKYSIIRRTYSANLYVHAPVGLLRTTRFMLRHSWPMNLTYNCTVGSTWIKYQRWAHVYCILACVEVVPGNWVEQQIMTPPCTELHCSVFRCTTATKVARLIPVNLPCLTNI